jgi:hypothetical protein
MDLRKRDRSADEPKAGQASPNPVDKQKPKNDQTPEGLKDQAAKSSSINISAARNLSGAFAATSDPNDPKDPTWFMWNLRSRTWILGNPPPATEQWLDLPSRTTECPPFEPDDFSAVSNLGTLDQATGHWSLPRDAPYAFSRAWASQVHKTQFRLHKKQKAVFQLAFRLAITPIDNLPGILKASDSSSVPASPLVNAWMGSTQVFGLNADGPAPVYQSGETITAVTPFGAKFGALKHLIPSKPFNTSDTLFLEGDEGAHDACRAALLTLEKLMRVQS